MLRAKVPAYVSLITLCAGCAIAALALGFSEPRNTTSPQDRTGPARDCAVRFENMSGYEGIKPLLYSERTCESLRYATIKGSVREYIEKMKSIGAISEAGFYLRDFVESEWTEYNGLVPFEPGSLMKVPLLMTYLRMAEKDAQVMSRKYTIPLGMKPPTMVVFAPTKSAEPGRSYSVAQLLDLAIRYSDNLAVSVLLSHMDAAQFHRTYTDLGLPDFSNGATSYPVNAKDYSVFMKALYNSTYLSLDDSELAVSLMMASEFDKGLKAGLPPETRIAHKFGESYDGRDWQLHETALVYVGSDAYLLTVMSKGPHMEALPGVLASISQLVYQEMIRLRGVAG